VNLGSGVADLILLPLDEYNKRDKGGSVSRGIQKGAKSFLKNATMESLKLGSKLADGTQVLLEQAEELLLGPSSGGLISLGESGSSLRQTIIAVSMGRVGLSFFHGYVRIHLI
jgi:autophagy-related protein 2